MGLTVATRNNMLTTGFPNANYYVALFIGDPQSGGVEVSTVGTDYVRQSFVLGVASNDIRSNSAKITFPIATANWGVISYIAIYDAITGGTLKGSQSISPQTINTSGQPYFSIGQLSISIT